MIEHFNACGTNGSSQEKVNFDAQPQFCEFGKRLEDEYSCEVNTLKITFCTSKIAEIPNMGGESNNSV